METKACATEDGGRLTDPSLGDFSSETLPSDFDKGRTSIPTEPKAMSDYRERSKLRERESLDPRRESRDDRGGSGRSYYPPRRDVDRYSSRDNRDFLSRRTSSDVSKERSEFRDIRKEQTRQETPKPRESPPKPSTKASLEMARTPTPTKKPPPPRTIEIKGDVSDPIICNLPLTENGKSCEKDFPGVQSHDKTNIQKDRTNFWLKHVDWEHKHLPSGSLSTVNGKGLFSAATEKPVDGMLDSITVMTSPSTLGKPSLKRVRSTTDNEQTPSKRAHQAAPIQETVVTPVKPTTAVTPNATTTMDPLHALMRRLSSKYTPSTVQPSSPPPSNTTIHGDESPIPPVPSPITPYQTRNTTPSRQLSPTPAMPAMSTIQPPQETLFRDTHTDIIPPTMQPPSKQISSTPPPPPSHPAAVIPPSPMKNRWDSERLHGQARQQLLELYERNLSPEQLRRAFLRKDGSDISVDVIIRTLIHAGKQPYPNYSPPETHSNSILQTTLPVEHSLSDNLSTSPTFSTSPPPNQPLEQRSQSSSTIPSPLTMVKREPSIDNIITPLFDNTPTPSKLETLQTIQSTLPTLISTEQHKLNEETPRSSPNSANETALLNAELLSRQLKEKDNVIEALMKEMEDLKRGVVRERGYFFEMVEEVNG